MADYVSLIPGAPLPEALADVPPLPAFAPASLDFVEALSGLLMRMPEARTYPELTALGFWMRRANLARLRADMERRAGEALLVPRGTVLHIAPSNVDTIFVYSWFLSLLTGNRNIVRLSSKPSPQADLLVGAIAKLLREPAHQEIARRTLLVRYAADDRTTTRFSAVCDVRVVWGGNATVEQIRKLPLPGTATEVAFANKYSLALIGAESWTEATECRKADWIEAFYNDAYWFDQMACSSPRLVLWLGDAVQIKAASTDFWGRFEGYLADRQERFGDADYVNKLVAEDALAIEADVAISTTSNNDLVRVWLDTPALHHTLHCGAGLFFESSLDSLDAMRPLLSRTVQTLSYAGVETQRLRDFIAANPLAGIDRVVPFGHALDFAPVWDGFDLLRVFMREITVA
ncbi:acyl-CoA reductase [Cupriavidus sp. D384]|uniref:acyl-CoA reductase n=1 Tax=Cupriavidus sp. D384 TaxID=1538095 RepID=UPI00082E1923|nr:acyl-CoA reductase [Cupriavidus sp. D384]